MKWIGARARLVTYLGVALFACISAPRVATAQCAFNTPAKAKLISSSLVRAHDRCPPTTYPVPNTSTGTGVPGCTPPFEASAYDFGPKGSCTFQMKTKRYEPCSGGCPDACTRYRFKLKCGDVRDGSFAPIAPSGTAMGWTLTLVARLTMNDASNGDLTVIDLPASIDLPPGGNGKLKLNVDPLDPDDGPILFGPWLGCQSNIPGCTNLQLVSLALRDPSGKIFAVLGSSTR